LNLPGAGADLENTVLLVQANMNIASVLADKIVTYMAITTLVLALATATAAMIW
jgi:hypothetical protein